MDNNNSRLLYNIYCKALLVLHFPKSTVETFTRIQDQWSQNTDKDEIDVAVAKIISVGASHEDWYGVCRILIACDPKSEQTENIPFPKHGTPDFNMDQSWMLYSHCAEEGSDLVRLSWKRFDYALRYDAPDIQQKLSRHQRGDSPIHDPVQNPKATSNKKPHPKPTNSMQSLQPCRQMSKRAPVCIALKAHAFSIPLSRSLPPPVVSMKSSRKRK